MTTKKDVQLWWLNGSVDKDPRGPAPNFLYIYDYSTQEWRYPSFIQDVFNLKKIN